MNKLRLWVLVLAATGILTGCDSCGGDTGITFAGLWKDPDVNQPNLTAIKNAFEQYYPDINIIEVMESGTPGRTGDRIKLPKNYIDTWPANLTNTQIKERVDLIYSTSITKAAPAAREAPRIAGEAPRIAGEASQLNGEATRFNGEAPRLNGEAPRFNGEATRFNGEASRLIGEAPRIRPYGV
jgi:hypothetical protein